MKKNVFIIVIAVIIAWIPMYMGAWDKTLPAGTTPFKDADDKIRDNNSAIETAFDNDHIFTTGSTQTGEHNQVTLAVSGSAPTVSANEGGVYSFDVDQGDATVIAELYYKDESANTIQITSSGNRLANATYFTATDNAGTGSVNVIKAHTDDEIQLGTNTTVNGTLNATGTLAADAAMTVATTLDVTGNIDPTTYETTNGGFQNDGTFAATTVDTTMSSAAIKTYIDTQDTAIPSGTGFVKWVAGGGGSLILINNQASANSYTDLDIATLADITAIDTLCFIKVFNHNGAAARTWFFRQNGETNEIGTDIASQSAMTIADIIDGGAVGYVWIATDSAGVIEYKGEDTSNVTITLVAYIQ